MLATRRDLTTSAKKGEGSAGYLFGDQLWILATATFFWQLIGGGIGDRDPQVENGCQVCRRGGGLYQVQHRAYGQGFAHPLFALNKVEDDARARSRSVDLTPACGKAEW